MRNRQQHQFIALNGASASNYTDYANSRKQPAEQPTHPECELSFETLDKVKESIELLYCHAQAQAVNLQSVYRVRDLSVCGEPGSRSLVFQIDMSGSFYDESRHSLESIVNLLRAKGYIVDELMQKQRDRSQLSIRLWFLVYEA